jgi:hypothetical protein
MAWTVLFHPLFESEFAQLSESVQDELIVELNLLRAFGPGLRRPHADTLKGSKHANMKELRFKSSDGVWRVAFAFDPHRQATILVAGERAA